MKKYTAILTGIISFLGVAAVFSPQHGGLNHLTSLSGAPVGLWDRFIYYGQRVLAWIVLLAAFGFIFDYLDKFKNISEKEYSTLYNLCKEFSEIKEMVSKEFQGKNEPNNINFRDYKRILKNAEGIKKKHGRNMGDSKQKLLVLIGANKNKVTL